MCKRANVQINLSVSMNHTAAFLSSINSMVGYEQPQFPYVALPHVAQEELGQPYGDFNLLQKLRSFKLVILAIASAPKLRSSSHHRPI